MTIISLPRERTGGGRGGGCTYTKIQLVTCVGCFSISNCWSNDYSVEFTTWTSNHELPSPSPHWRIEVNVAPLSLEEGGYPQQEFNLGRRRRTHLMVQWSHS